MINKKELDHYQGKSWN